MPDPLTQDQGSVIEQSLRWLGALPAAVFILRLGRDIEVRMNAEESDMRPWTMHHYALTPMICGMCDRWSDEDLGVAPSTLEHRRRAGAACAQ